MKGSLAILALIGNISAINLQKIDMVQVSSETNVKVNVMAMVQAIDTKVKNLNQIQLHLEMNNDNKENQKKLLKQMEVSLLDVTNDVLVMSMESEDDPNEVKKISGWMENISQKVPLVQKLQKRLDVMKGLDPLMDGILDKMNDVVDNSHLMKIQMDQKAYLNPTGKSIADIIADAIRNNQAPRIENTPELPEAPISSISTQQAVIKNSLKTAMYDIEVKNQGNPQAEFEGKIAAVSAIGGAAIAATRQPVGIIPHVAPLGLVNPLIPLAPEHVTDPVESQEATVSAPTKPDVKVEAAKEPDVKVEAAKEPVVKVEAPKEPKVTVASPEKAAAPAKSEAVAAKEKPLDQAADAAAEEAKKALLNVKPEPEAKSESLVEAKSIKPDQRSEVASIYGQMADYGQSVKNIAEEQIVDNE